MDNGHEYFMYLHPTFGTHYAARLLNLGRAVYHIEFATFPLIANDPMDLITLQQWVAEGAQRAGLDIDAIQRSGLTTEIIEGLTARTSELDLQ